MSQVPMSPPPVAPPGPPRSPLGTGARVAIALSGVVGLVYTVVLGTLLAVSVGLAIDTAESATTSVPAPDDSDGPFADEGDPFGDDPFGGHSGDPTDPLYGYPGYEEGDASLVLDQPSAEEAVALSEQAVAAVEAAVLGDWDSAADEYYERSENAYGGPSLLVDYLSATDYAEADLSTDADKQAVVDRFEAALAPLGFDSIDIADAPSEWSEVGYGIRGELSDEEARATLWVVTASSADRAVPAVELGLVDLDSDPSGEVEAMLTDVGLRPSESGAFLAGYASGVLESGDRDEFTARMEEFGGIATA